VTLGAAPDGSGFDVRSREGARALLEAVVRTPSPSGAESEVARLLVAALAPHVDHCEVDAAGNALAVVGCGPLNLTLLAHIDTVPGWLPVRVEGEVLHGRGSVDAKGSAVALALAAARSGPRVRERLTIRFIGAVEEEAPSSRGAQHALRTYPPPDALIIGEPSGADAITLGYKGHARMRLWVEAPLAHSARAEASAADRLVAQLAQLTAWVAAEPGERLFDRLQLTVLELSSHQDGLHERAEALLSWRLPLAWPPERLQAALARQLSGVEDGVGWALEGGVAAVRGAADSKLARVFRAAIRRAGAEPGRKVKTGTSDWNLVAPHWRCDALAYGPGDAALDHTPEERIDLTEFDRALAVLSEVVERLADLTQT